MASLDQISQALLNADAAGDTEAATALAQEYRRQSETPKEEPLIDISDTLKAAGQAIGGITTTAPHAFRQLYSGLDNPWQRSEGYKASQAGLDKYQQELEAANQAAVESGDISTASRGMRQVGPSLGFSAGAMGAGLVGSTATGAAYGSIGRNLGAIAGPEGAIAGEVTARAAGALAAGYGAAYRMAGAQFLDDARKEIDAKFQNKLGRLPNEQEQKEAYDELLPLAQAFGHAEAGPEAIGNLAMARAGKFILGLGINNVKGLAANALKKVGAGAGATLTELGGETATQVEQKRIDAQKNAWMNGQAPPNLGDRTVEEYKTALGEVAPATLATMGLIGSVPATYKAVTTLKSIIKPSEPAPVQEVTATAVEGLGEAEKAGAPVSATAEALAQINKLKTEGKSFEQQLQETEDENLFNLGLDAEQEKLRQQQAYVDAQQRQAQFQSLGQNEQPITPATGNAVPPNGGAEIANLEAGNGSESNLGEPVLSAAQPEEAGQAPSENVVGSTKVSNNPAEIHRKRKADYDSDVVRDAEGDIDRTATRGIVAAKAKAAGMTVDEWAADQAAKNIKANEDFFDALNEGDTLEWVDANGRKGTGRVEIGLDGKKTVRNTTEGSPEEDYQYTNKSGIFSQVADSLKVTPKAQQNAPRITELARQAAARLAGTEQGPNLNFPQQQTPQNNAVQIPSTGEVLQRQQDQVGETGRERSGMEQGQQGQEIAGKGQGQEEVALTDATTDSQYESLKEIRALGAMPEKQAKAHLKAHPELVERYLAASGQITSKSQDAKINHLVKLGQRFLENAGTETDSYQIEADKKYHRENTVSRPDSELKETVQFHNKATGTVGTMSLVDPQIEGVPRAYYFNQLASKEKGKGAGTQILSQLKEYADYAGLPIVNEVNSTGSHSQGQTIEWYKQRGFKPLSATNLNLLVYWPRFPTPKVMEKFSPAPTQETPSSPAAKLEKEGVVPASSSETEVGGRSNIPVETKETPQGEVSSGKVEGGNAVKAPDTTVNQKPEQPASQKLIDMAKRFGGRIAWADGDMGIIEAFQLFGSKSLYVAIVGDRYSTTDFTLLKPNNRKDLLGENEELFTRKREELIKANEKRLAENPDGPFTNGRTLVVSKGVPDKVASVFKEWAKMLGLNAPTRIVLTTFNDGIEMAAGYGGKFRRIGSTATKQEGEKGVSAPLGDNDFHIAYQDDISFARILEVIAHELGHVLEKQAFKNLPQEQQREIMFEHEKWLKRVGPMKAIDGIRELRAMRTGRIHPGTDIERFDELTAYWKSFSEWFADQVAKWSTTTAKPLSVVEKFFARLGKKLREFFFSSKHRFAPNQKVADWLNSLSPDFQTGEISEPSGEVISANDDTGENSTSDSIERKALENLLKKRPDLKPALIEKAKKYFATDDFEIIKKLLPTLREDIERSIQDADPNRLHAQLAKDKAEFARLQKMDEDDRKAEEEKAALQAKLNESRRTALDSIIGTPTGVEMNVVSPADGQESLALVHNTGDVPGVLNAFVGTSKEFLANKENETNFPALHKILSGGRVEEGYFAYGRSFVFTDGIAINKSDRRNAVKLGVTPAVAAVRRVLIHEGLVHRGIYGLPAHLQRQILQWVRQNASPAELDNLALDYPQYANWATNEAQLFGLCEEFLAKKVEKLTKIPTNGPLARLMDILRDIWRWITGNEGEPTVQNLRDVVKLLKAGAEAADQRLVNGGAIKMSQLRAQGFVTPEMDAEYAKAVADGDVAKQQAMVDAAAKAAGYDTKLLYHTSSAKEPFTEFKYAQLSGGEERFLKSAKGGFNFAMEGLSPGWFTSSPTQFKSWKKTGDSNVTRAYVNLKKPIILEAEPGAQQKVLEGKKRLADLLAQRERIQNQKEYAGHSTWERIRDEIRELEKEYRPSPHEETQVLKLTEEANQSYVPQKRLREIRTELKKLEPKVGDAQEIRARHNEQKYGDPFYQLESLGRMAEQEHPELLRGAALRKALLDEGRDGIILQGTNADHALGDDSLATWVIPLKGGAQIKSADPITRDAEGNVIPLSARFNPTSADIRFSKVTKPSFANPINAELAKAAERFRQMNERQAVETPEGLKELFNPNAEGSGTTHKLFETAQAPESGQLGDIEHMSPANIDWALTHLDGRMRQEALGVSREHYGKTAISKQWYDFVAGKVQSAEALQELNAMYGEMNPKAQFVQKILPHTDFVQGDIEALTPEQAAWILENTDGENRQELLGVTQDQYSDPEIARQWAEYLLAKVGNNPAAVSELEAMYREMLPEVKAVSPQKIRSEIRSAYDRALVGEGSVQASLQKVFDEAKKAIPTLTERQFGEQVQNLYEDGSAFLVPADRGAEMLAAGEKWGVFDAAGQPATFMGVMPVEMKASVVPKPILDKQRTELQANNITGESVEYQGKPLTNSQGEVINPIWRTEEQYRPKEKLAGRFVKQVAESLENIADLPTEVLNDEYLTHISAEHNGSFQTLLIVQAGQYLRDKAAETSDPEEKQKLLNAADVATAFLRKGASQAGLDLNMIKQVQKDPRFAGMFAVDTIKTLKKEEQASVVNPNFTEGAVEGVQGLNNQAGEEADVSVEDSLEDFWIDKAESSLPEKAKTILQKVREWIAAKANALRDIALINLALLKKGGNIKQSVAKNSAASNRFDSMTIAELEAERSKKEKDVANYDKKITEGLEQIGGIMFTSGQADSPESGAGIAKKLSKIPKKEKLLASGKMIELKKLLDKTRAGWSWKQIFTLPKAGQIRRRADMLQKVKENEAFKDLTDEEKAALVDLLDQAWYDRKAEYFGNKLKKSPLVKLPFTTNQGAAKHLHDSTPELLKAFNDGTFNRDTFNAILAKKYGVKQIDQSAMDKAEKLAEELQDPELPSPVYAKKADELLKLIADTQNFNVAKMLNDFWVTSVLAGPRTWFDIGFAALNGLQRILVDGTALALKGDVKTPAEALKRFFGVMPQAFKEAVHFIKTGDVSLLVNSKDQFARFLGRGLQGGQHSSTSYQLSHWNKDKHAGAPAWQKTQGNILRGIGHFMQIVERLLTALDHINSTATKYAYLPIAIAQNSEKYKNARLPNAKELEQFRTQAKAYLLGGKEPTTDGEKTVLDAWTRHFSDKFYSDWQDVVDGAAYAGSVSSGTLDPEGIVGQVYNWILAASSRATSASDEAKVKAKGLLNSPHIPKATAYTRYALATLGQLAAYSVRNLLGFRFIRFSASKFNDSLTYIPGVGLLRLAENDNDHATKNQMIWNNQAFGVILSLAGYAIIKSMADEDDPEKRGFDLEGSWDGIGANEKKQRSDAGAKEYSASFYRNGKKITLVYKNWPISAALSAIGTLTDMVKYNRKKWDEKEFADRLIAAAAIATTSTLDAASMSQFAELIGKGVNNSDPDEAFVKKITRAGTNFAGGFIPRIFKDLDYWLIDDNARKYDTIWQNFGKEVPVWRSHIGAPKLDIFSEPVRTSRSPWSRAIVSQPEDAAYRTLGLLNSRDIWLTPSNGELRTVGTKNHRRPLTSEEQDRYVKLVGAGYKEVVEKYGNRVLAMPKERAKAFIADKTREVRDRAEKKAVRHLTPAAS